MKMDLDSFEGRQDFFLLKLSADRHNRLTGKSGFSQFEFQLHLDLMCNGEPQIDGDVFLIRLRDSGYIDRNLSYVDNDAPYLLTKEGAEFIRNNGFTKQKADKEIGDKIKAETLKQLLRSKAAFVLSIAAILISLASLVVAIWKALQKNP